jgi:hypothetical protein
MISFFDVCSSKLATARTDLLMPVFQLVEGTFVGNVVHKQCGDSALIVSLCDRPTVIMSSYRKRY